MRKLDEYSGGEASDEEKRNALLKKKLKELQKLQELEKQKREIALKYLDSKAYERLSNIKAVNPELYDSIIAIIVQLVNAGRLNTKLTDQQLVQILLQITSKPDKGIKFIKK